jgi:hypothetical protein
MKKYFRSFASLAVIGVFLVLAWSCDDYGYGEDVLFDCKWYPVPITKSHEIFIKAIDRVTNKPIPKTEINIYSINYFVKPGVGSSCEIRSQDELNKIFLTGEDGIVYLPIDRKYYSEYEYILIRVGAYKEGYVSQRLNIILRPNDTGLRKDIYLLEGNDRP